MVYPFPLMIDSGAYSAFTKKQTVDMDAYIAFCHETRKSHPQAVFVTLDVIGDGKGSYENWREIRSQGVPVLPVYHAGPPDRSSERYLVKYLDQTDHIGIGAIASMSSHRRKVALDRLWRTYLVDGKRMPVARVHGMGITSFPLMKRYPWWSLDSTSWLHISMYGHIMIPKTRRGQWDYTERGTKVAFSLVTKDRKLRGLHFDNLPPGERTTTQRWLKENGFTLGFECPLAGDPEHYVALEGLRSYFGQRAQACALYFARFLAAMPWPRPFGRSARGFGISHDSALEDLRDSPERVRVQAIHKPTLHDTPGCTVLYLSGSSYRGEDYLRPRRAQMPHVGILLSYHDLQREGVTWRRLRDVRDLAPKDQP